MALMSKCDEKGRPLKETTRCGKCGRKFGNQGSLRNHIKVHRDGKTTSYHQKGDLYKSEKYTYEC